MLQSKTFKYGYDSSQIYGLSIQRLGPIWCCVSCADTSAGTQPGAATLIAFSILETTLEVGAYRKDVRTAQRGVGGVWKECAKQIVKQLRAWIDANREQVLARRRPL